MKGDVTMDSYWLVYIAFLFVALVIVSYANRDELGIESIFGAIGNALGGILVMALMGLCLLAVVFGAVYVLGLLVGLGSSM